MAWGQGDKASLINRERIDIAYFPEYHVWKEKRSLQLMMEDFSLAKPEKRYPDREILASVYRFLLGEKRQGNELTFDMERLFERYIQVFPKINLFTFQKSLAIFEELGLLRHRDTCYIMLPPPKEKMDLQKSRIFREGNSL